MNNVVVLLALQNSYKMIQTAEKEKNDAAKNRQNISMKSVSEKITKEKRNGSQQSFEQSQRDSTVGANGKRT